MMQKKISLLSLLLLGSFTMPYALAGIAPRITYYIDSRKGDDRSSGTNPGLPWKSIARANGVALHAGDSLCFKRGSSFIGPLQIKYSGLPGKYITVTDYGAKNDPAPAFSNPVFAAGNYGNCIKISGSYVVAEHLFCNKTAAYSPIDYKEEGWVVWEMGAIHIDSGAEHCIVRNNEIADCVAGIRSNGSYAQISGNYIHDCNRVLKQWTWGPLGIWLGADHQVVANNRVFNYGAVDSRIGWGPNAYGNGADGGAFEIDDARINKSDIVIQHNYTRDCQGFLEVTWTDVKKNPLYTNFRIVHNVSDDYQQFVALWCGARCVIENNTIIRRKVNANDWGVFNITQLNGQNIVRNNIVVTEKNVVIFNTGRKGTAMPYTIISHNLYFAAHDSLRMGKEGPGEAAVFTDPKFVNYEHASEAADFKANAGSATTGIGAFAGAGTLSADAPHFLLARAGMAFADIYLAKNASVAQNFAAAELSAYLQKISGARFLIQSSKNGNRPRILIRPDRNLEAEAYSISLQDNDLVLTAGSDRALLYAVYDLLHRLGCEWLSPQLDFYQGKAEYVPHADTLQYSCAPVHEHPGLSYRKLDVEEGRSHTIDNLKQLIAWMPKVRLNIFMVPLNYQGAGKVQWDNWRQALIPELKKRDLLIEVGGHGYQNFINARMEKGMLFKQHPDWFGKNKNCVADTTMNLVFNTANAQAVRYFTVHVIEYLRQHPEIDIFDCWPPDVAKWNECPETSAPGSPAERQAMLMNQLAAAIKANKLPQQLEVIAYGQVLMPPEKQLLDSSILVDICPINQSFEKPIYDSTAATNGAYTTAVLGWRQHFTGHIGIYSYYRKYAWRSLPVILPHYMQKELQWYSGLPLQGLSTYAEPGDWFTYELNHYVLAHLAWNTYMPVDSLIDQYARIRYGPAAAAARTAYLDLEQVVRSYGSLPYTALKNEKKIEEATGLLNTDKAQINAIVPALQQPFIVANLNRLLLMLQYAISDLEILQLRAAGISGAAVDDKVKQLVDFMEQHAAAGVFLLHDKNNIETFLKHYNNIK